jgi:hypothetical protein
MDAATAGLGEQKGAVVNWIYHVKEPQHWVSSPPGYFIVQEESDGGRSKYVVYKGHFENWPSVVGADAQLEKIGEFMTLRDAKRDAHFQPAK